MKTGLGPRQSPDWLRSHLPTPVQTGSGSAGRGHCSTASQSFDSPGMDCYYALVFALSRAMLLTPLGHNGHESAIWSTPTRYRQTRL